jgi:toxin ParE1/3/4
MSRVERTLAAEQDLEEIGYYIAKQRCPATAEKILREIHAKCSLYAGQPEMGTLRPDLGEHHRVFHHKRWVVIYRPIQDGIEVLRVVDGARDYPSLFPGV